MSRWAADNDEGLHAYVITKLWIGRLSSRIEYASSLVAAKGAYGCTRENYVTIRVRRATPADVEAYQ